MGSVTDRHTKQDSKKMLRHGKAQRSIRSKMVLREKGSSHADKLMRDRQCPTAEVAESGRGEDKDIKN